MQLKPLKEILAMTKEKIDEALAPVRARQIKAKAELEVAKLQEKLMTLEREIQEACVKKDIDFTIVLSKMDEFDLTTRKVKQFDQLVADLFPKA